MVEFDVPRYKNIKILADFYGLWPFDLSRKPYYCYIVLNFVYFLTFLPRFTFLMNKELNTLDAMVQNLLDIVMQANYMIVHSVLFFNMPKFRKILQHVAEDWNSIVDKSEIRILNKYSGEGYLLLQIISPLVGSFALVHFVMPFIPPLLDIIFPLENSTYPAIVTFHVDFIIFHESDYHYLISLIGLMLGVPFSYEIILAASYLLMTLYHAIGLFAITCYRLETMNLLPTEKNEPFKSFDNFVRRNLARVVIMHNKSIRFVKMIEEIYNLTQLLGQGMAVVGIGIFFFYYSMFNKSNILNILYVMPWGAALVITMFVLHWTGQKIIDSSQEVFYAAYYSKWHEISTQNCKTVGIVMIRSLTPCTLTCGKLFVLSFESFSRFIKTAVSYMMVLRNTMQQ